MIDKRSIRVCKAGGVDITLQANAMTYLIYKSQFGRDLLQDIVEYSRQQMSNAKLLADYKEMSDLDKESWNKLTVLEREALYDKYTSSLDSLSKATIDTEFLINIIATMIATYEYPNKRDVNEIIQSIPLTLLQDFAVQELIQLLIPSFKEQKKTAKAKSR